MLKIHKLSNKLIKLKDIGATICMMPGAAIVTMEAIGIGLAMSFISNSVLKTDTYNEKQLLEKEEVDTRDVEKTSLQIDLLNKLYKINQLLYMNLSKV